jgi:polygalacturonase
MAMQPDQSDDKPVVGKFAFRRSFREHITRLVIAIKKTWYWSVPCIVVGIIVVVSGLIYFGLRNSNNTTTSGGNTTTGTAVTPDQSNSSKEPSATTPASGSSTQAKGSSTQPSGTTGSTATGDTSGGTGTTPPQTYITPEEYGAVGNGVHDDSAAIQDALNAAAGKEPVLLGEKTYYVGTMLIVPNNSTLEGSGSSSILHFTWYDQTGSASHGASYIQVGVTGGTATSNVILKNFAVNGGGTGLPTGPSSTHPNGSAVDVRLLATNNFTISGLTVYDAPSMGIQYNNSTNGIITNNNVHNTGRDGITGFYGNSSGSANVTVSHNTITDVGDDAIAINGAHASGDTPGSGRPSGFTVTGNTINGWPSNPNGIQLGRGILVMSDLNVTVTNNTVNRTESDGIVITDDEDAQSGGTGADTYSEYITVTGNTIENAGQDYSQSDSKGLNLHAGLYILNADYITFTGNTITNSYGQNEVVTNCSDCTVK